MNPRFEDILKHTSRVLGTGDANELPAGDVCASCGLKDGVGEGSLKRCTGCQSALYCGKECQKKEWRGHKKTCQREQRKE